MKTHNWVLNKDRLSLSNWITCTFIFICSTVYAVKMLCLYHKYTRILRNILPICHSQFFFYPDNNWLLYLSSFHTLVIVINLLSSSENVILFYANIKLIYRTLSPHPPKSFVFIANSGHASFKDCILLFPNSCNKVV